MTPKLKINLSQLQRNFRFLSKHTGAKILAVVKADAYGLGALKIAHALKNEAIFGFAVAVRSELEELVAGGIRKPILHLGVVNPSILSCCKFDQVRVSLHQLSDIRLIESELAGSERRVRVHLKIDTGMSRLGISPQELPQILDAIRTSKHIELEGIWSHLATSDETDPTFFQKQLQQYRQIKQMVTAEFPSLKFFHIANSAAVLQHPESHFNLVRPGIALYGVSPLGKPFPGIVPVAQLKAPVVMLKRIPKGSSVGYSRTVVAEKDMRIAVLQAGYADGLPVRFSNRVALEFNGHRFPVFGKMSMDLTTIDCNGYNLKPGDQINFWSIDGGENSIESLAKKHDLLVYQFLTGLTRRVRREYFVGE